MTDFDVQTVALRQLAKLLDRAGDDTGKAKTHLEKMASFRGSEGEGLLNMTLESHRAAYDTLSGWLGKLADTTLADVSKAVTGSADYYDSTDATTAANLDKTYPETNVAEAREHGSIPIRPESGNWFDDAVRPTLSEPGDYRYELYGGMSSWWDVASPMAWAGGAIEGVTGVAALIGWLKRPFNPQRQIARNFIGDWAAVRSAADVLRSVGSAVDAISININSASAGTDDVWQGNAGDGAVVYLMNLAKTLGDAKKPIDTLAKQYEDASAEMQRLRDTMVGLLDLMGDSALAAMVGIKIAYSLKFSGIGASISALIVAYAGYRIGEVVVGVGQAVDIIGQLRNATNGLKTAQDDFAGIGDLSLPALPESPTNIPGR